MKHLKRILIPGLFIFTFVLSCSEDDGLFTRDDTPSVSVANGAIIELSDSTRFDMVNPTISTCSKIVKNDTVFYNLDIANIQIDSGINENILISIYCRPGQRLENKAYELYSNYVNDTTKNTAATPSEYAIFKIKDKGYSTYYNKTGKIEIVSCNEETGGKIKGVITGEVYVNITKKVDNKTLKTIRTIKIMKAEFSVNYATYMLKSHSDNLNN